MAFQSQADDLPLHLNRSGPLFQAQEFYLQKKIPEMVLALKEALEKEPTDRKIHEAIFRMIELSYQERKLDSPWPADPGLQEVILSAQNFPVPNIKLEMWLQNLTPDLRFHLKRSPQQRDLIRFPSAHCLSQPLPDQKTHQILCNSSEEALIAGLYTLETFYGGKTFTQWVILTNSDVTFAPFELKAREPDMKLSSQPHFKWSQPEEPNDLLSVAVLEREGARPIWSVLRQFKSGSTQEIQIGHEPDQQGRPHLREGSYLLDVSYYRNRRFGPIQISRAHRLVQPFHANPKVRPPLW